MTVLGIFPPTTFCRRQKVKGMVRNREKREDLARGVGGVEFVQFVRHKFTARMSWQREISSQSYFTLLIMSDTIICARRSVFYRVACTDAAPCTLES